jgi:hypothetical protein
MVIRWVVGCLIALACAFWAVAIVASPASGFAQHLSLRHQGRDL